MPRAEASSVVEGSDAARFFGLMESHGSGAAGLQVEEAAATDAASGVSRAGGETAGDAILRGLGHVGGKVERAVEEVKASLAALGPGEAMKTSELLRLQFAVTQITLHQDLAGKVVGKATQNLDTFLKNQ
ncbi:MAG: type secretion protein [Candidatus Hydrogenedentes bacterium]|nr:type secretion protein [Candidatus Hydrogenedentota bacterium]